MFEFSPERGWFAQPILEFKKGLLHGFGGETFNKAKVRSWTNADYSAAILKDPKIELEKALQAEVQSRPGEVGPPFSIFLLRADGEIIDYSKDPICKLPASLGKPTVPKGNVEH